MGCLLVHNGQAIGSGRNEVNETKNVSGAGAGRDGDRRGRGWAVTAGGLEGGTGGFGEVPPRRPAAGRQREGASSNGRQRSRGDHKVMVLTGDCRPREVFGFQTCSLEAFRVTRGLRVREE